MNGTENRVRQRIAVNPKSLEEVNQPAAKVDRLDLSSLIESKGAKSAPMEAMNAPLLNPACFVCGQENAMGLRLVFQTENRRASAAWTPRAGWESYQGIIHGGVISSVLDEAMSKAILSGGDEAFTADLRIRFRKKVCVEDVIQVHGWVVSVAKRKILAEATLTSEDGEERAHAWGVFLTAPQR